MEDWWIAALLMDCDLVCCNEHDMLMSKHIYSSLDFIILIYTILYLFKEAK